MPPQQQHLPVGYAYLVLFLVPAVATALLLGTLQLVKDEDAAVAICVAAAAALVVIVASVVTLSAVVRDLRGDHGGDAADARWRAADENFGSATVERGGTDRRIGLSIPYGVAMLVTFDEAAVRVAAAAPGAAGVDPANGSATPDGGGPRVEEVDAAATYGIASPVTGLSGADVRAMLEDPEAMPPDADLVADLEMEDAATAAAAAGELPEADELPPEILPDEPEPGDIPADRREGG